MPKWRECVEISLHTILSEIGHGRDTRSKARLGYECQNGESVSREISVVRITGPGTHRAEYNNTLIGLCRSLHFHDSQLSAATTLLNIHHFMTIHWEWSMF